MNTPMSPPGRESPPADGDSRAEVPVGFHDAAATVPELPPEEQAVLLPPFPLLEEAPHVEATPPVVDRWSIVPSPSHAPTIGKVLPPTAPVGGPVVGFRQPGLVLDSLYIGSWHIAAGSVAGAGHLAGGTPRQDAYDFALTADGRLVVAIADGLGSRADSQVGARMFCESVARLASDEPDDSASSFLRRAALWTKNLAGLTYELGPDDISFVAAVAVIGPDDVTVARVGDVSAFGLDAGGAFTELFVEPEGHVNIVRNSLPSADPVPEVAVSHTRDTFVLTTDGLANDLRTSEGVRTWLAGCWGGLVDAHGMGDALRYRRRGSHDDRTAVVVSFDQTQTREM